MREGFFPKPETPKQASSEWVDLLTREYEQTPVEGRAELLTKRYFALLAGDSIESVSPYALRQSQELEFGSIINTVSGTTFAMESSPLINQYGPSQLLDVPPGQWVDLAQLGEQDVVGSSAFTACSALIARAGSRVLFGHVLSSLVSDLDGIYSTFQKRLDQTPATFTVVTPLWQAEHEGSKQWNARLQNMVESWKKSKADIRHHHLPYMDSENNYGFWDTSILVTAREILAMGVNYHPLPKERYSAYSSRRNVAIPLLETMRVLT